MTSFSNPIKKWDKGDRIGGLRRFAFAITFLNVLGHFVLGFEAAFAYPLVALATAYALELVLEWIDAKQSKRTPGYAGDAVDFVDFLLPAHISAMAVSMLLYPGGRLMPIVLASAAVIVSKNLFRAPAGKGTRHFLNPSNAGITLVLLLFPSVGIAQPYQFTENLGSIGDWVLPGIIICSGTLLNWRFTHKLPLIGAWVGGFFLQALIRSIYFGTPLEAALAPMTGVAFLLYTFYMVSDPATTPFNKRNQVGFGLAVAAVYGMLMVANVVFGLFFALTIVCALRGCLLYAAAWSRDRVAVSVPVEQPAK